MSTSAKPEKSKQERERQDWLIVLLILLFGLCCVAGAGQYALRLVPNWQLDTDMGSNIDLNSQFLTGKPQQLFEPLDPAILTQPAWVNGNVFLTPGANSLVKNSTPLPTSQQDTPIPTVPGTIPVGTTTLAVTTSPTNTLVWIPVPATKTSKPGPDATNTSPPSAPDADLWITKDSTTNTYTAGSTLTYRVRVGNHGPDNLSNVTVRDNKPDQIASWTWTCNNPGVNDCNGASLNSANFTDIVNLPSGASIEYTVDVTTNSFGGDLTNTALVNRAGYTETNPGDEQDGHTHTLVVIPPEANLWVTKDDYATNYVANGTTTYTVRVGNSGPDGVIGAIVTDTKPDQVANWTWTCITPGVNGCDGTPLNSANFSDTVDLPSGSSIEYMVVATTSNNPSGNLINTASISLPAGYTGPSPVSATDPVPDVQIIPASLPPEMTVPFDLPTYNVTSGNPLILNMSIDVTGDSDWDLVYYELPVGGGIDMDQVVIRIGDGHNWYTILNWGNGAPDANTNIDITVIGGNEDDNRHLTGLYNGTGVLINVDGLGIPIGTYSYISFTVSNDTSGDGCDIDAVVPYP